MIKKTRLRVLIADDEFYCRALLKEILTSMNCEVVGEAVNGVEALEMFRDLKPHLVMLDMNMPMKTGDEVLKELLEENPGALVIMVSSVADVDEVKKCISLGAINYIRKDTPVEDIKRIIKESWDMAKASM